MRLFQASGVFHYDLTPVSGTNVNDLNFAKLDSYFQRYQFEFSRETESQKINILENTDILSVNGEVTLGGLLVFGVNPSRYLYQNGISFACFSGNTINELLIDKKNIDGDLCRQVDLCVSIIKSLIPTPSRIDNTKRVDTIQTYPDKVFRELITNAMVHRNYAISGSKTRVFLFKNRLEVISPGRLPNTVTIEKLPYGVSFATNPVLVKFMENLRYIDQLGRGLPMVYQEAGLLGKKVVFEEIGEEFKVTLEL
ncbi:hypothetical protein JCM14469_08530 [Desulfatiferula olefinivorans]